MDKCQQRAWQNHTHTITTAAQLLDTHARSTGPQKQARERLPTHIGYTVLTVMGATNGGEHENNRDVLQNAQLVLGIQADQLR